jgi:acetyl-CoA carboxylase biotin carboxyl carrier protein
VAEDDSFARPHPFDVQTIEHLVDLMSRHQLNEIDLREGDQRIRLLRGRLEEPLPVPQPPLVAVPAAPPPPAAAADAPRPSRHLIEVKSPGPGTFYVAPKPGAEPYVRVGSRVTPTTPVGQLEAMKLFTEITAECSGIVVEILVENQQAVEYGQVLFRVDPAG